MKRLSGTLLLTASLLLAATGAQVPPPSLKLQGYLTDTTVVPAVPANGTFPMQFGVWDQMSGGTQLQLETLPSVTVVDGLYDVSLPFGPALFDGPRWLEITVDGETLLPRLRFESSPFAYLADRANVAVTVATDGVDTDAIQDQAVTLDKLALACSPGDTIVRTAGGWACLPVDADCAPGATRACYTGPPGTEGVGICTAGIETCQPGGTFGPCDGQTLPAMETCNGIDDDCDGAVDEAGATGGQTFFADADGDGFGGTSNQLLCAPSPPFTATNSSDCYDQNANARPGQTQFFPTHRGDGSYDYDCDGNAQRRWPTGYSCTSGCGSFNEGWTGAVPPCGATAQFGIGCDSFVTCEEDQEIPRTQECR